MTRISFYGDENSLTLTAVGHCEYKKGDDIVCSAASALICTLANLVRHSGVKSHIELKEGNSKVICYPDEKIRGKLEDIYSYTLFGLTIIEKRYPDNLKVKLL